MNEVLRLLEEKDLNAVVFRADVRDAWPTAAYERVAEVGGPIGITAYIDSVEARAMAMVQGPWEHNEGVIVAAETNRRLVEHLLLRRANVLLARTAAIRA